MPRRVRHVAPWIALIAIVLGSTLPRSMDPGVATSETVSLSVRGDAAWQCAPATPVPSPHPSRAATITLVRRATTCTRAGHETDVVSRPRLDRPPLYVLHGAYRV